MTQSSAVQQSGTQPSGAILQSPTASHASPIGAFGALMLRDTRVLSRELLPFAVRVIMQPLLFLFVFTYLFPRMGSGAGIMMGGGSFATVLLPGLMAVAIMFTGIAAVALPLSTEFGVTREIDDRVMCPLPVYAVAIEKVCFSAIQSMFAALLVLPLAYYVPSTPVLLHVTSWPVFVLVLVLASLVAGALGLAIGSSVQPRQIGLVFSIVVIPITFLGCVYYPWALLSHVRWLQIAVLVNPIVYMSEGLRTALTPGVPHMPTLAIVGGLLVSLLVLGTIGIRNFIGRVVA
jgi:ABC-2 type transport system permease protein